MIVGPQLIAKWKGKGWERSYHFGKDEREMTHSCFHRDFILSRETKGYRKPVTEDTKMKHRI